MGTWNKDLQKKATTGKDSLLTTQGQIVMRLDAESLAVGVAEHPMAMDNSGPSAR